MLLIFNRATRHIPLKITSIEVEFVVQFNEKLLVKQKNEILQILDVASSEQIEISRTEFMTPSTFIFLCENQLFLTLKNRTVSVWNFRQELVTSFKDQLLWHPSRHQHIHKKWSRPDYLLPQDLRSMDGSQCSFHQSEPRWTITIILAAARTLIHLKYGARL
jgi:hypothetical protein